mmetsp:Transcript_43199/g.131537  ORF Transcript_43199/g.131537 Transcript_43199/m.131537 type:complete len:112 (-) Transcript_43199:99-434(-)
MAKKVSSSSYLYYVNTAVLCQYCITELTEVTPIKGVLILEIEYVIFSMVQHQTLPHSQPQRFKNCNGAYPHPPLVQGAPLPSHHHPRHKSLRRTEVVPHRESDHPGVPSVL